MRPSRVLSLNRWQASRLSRFVLFAGALLLATVWWTNARADVPGRVGRIAFMEGDVQAYSETDPEWKVAYVNQPITARNSIFVGDAGRAEISIGSTTLAMDAGSQIDIQAFDDDTFDANVVRGRVSVRVRRLDANDRYTLGVPGADFALLRPGRYRIDALQSTSGITVFAGQASVAGDRGDVLVEAGNGMRVATDRANPDAPPQLLSAAPVAVPLDDWVEVREARFRNSQSERYVSPNMTGYEDLDANGRWANEEDLGPVWYPTTYVREDWAPYRYGRWAYVQPWGYTWVDDAPWGFAPFHYGRWVQVGNRWGWCPGAYVSRPAYAPALVGFYGGDGFSASFGLGAGPAVGWYPLAPWQRYSPHYTRSAGYINQVNNIVIVDPPRRFGPGNGGRDWNREHGGTIAPQQAFASQRSISRIAIPAPREFAGRGAPLAVADLPRPALIPGAVRRGPDGGAGGGGRPAFRGPRDLAGRPNDPDARPFERGPRPAAPVVGGQVFPQEAQRPNGLPPSYRRMPDDRRPAIGVEAPRQAMPQQPTPGQAVPQQAAPQNDVPFQRERFNREPRPQQPLSGEGQTPPTINRGFTPRPQEQPRPVQQQPGVERPSEQRPFEQRPFERPNREMRNVQQPPAIQQAPQPQVVDRPPQRVERPAPAARQPAPVPQPAPAAPIPQPPVAQPRPQPAQPQPGVPDPGTPRSGGPGGVIGRDR